MLSRLEVICSVIGLVLLAVGVQLGLVAAAASRLPFMLTILLINARPIARVTDCTVRELVAATAPSAVLMVAAAGVICWFAAIFATAHELRGEIESWVRLAVNAPRTASAAGELLRSRHCT